MTIRPLCYPEWNFNFLNFLPYLVINQICCTASFEARNRIIPDWGSIEC